MKEKIAVEGFSGCPLQEAFSHIRAMGKALAFAHESGIVHFDFRSSNVIITQDNQLKVLDFGIARAIGESKVGDGTAPVAMAI